MVAVPADMMRRAVRHNSALFVICRDAFADIRHKSEGAFGDCSVSWGYELVAESAAIGRKFRFVGLRFIRRRIA